MSPIEQVDISIVLHSIIQLCTSHLPSTLVWIDSPCHLWVSFYSAFKLIDFLSRLFLPLQQDIRFSQYPLPSRPSLFVAIKIPLKVWLTYDNGVDMVYRVSYNWRSINSLGIGYSPVVLWSDWNVNRKYISPTTVLFLAWRVNTFRHRWVTEFKYQFIFIYLRVLG